MRRGKGYHVFFLMLWLLQSALLSYSSCLSAAVRLQLARWFWAAEANGKCTVRDMYISRAHRHITSARTLTEDKRTASSCVFKSNPHVFLT